MKRAEIEKLENCISRVFASHKEISTLSKKSPLEAINNFKLTILNSILRDANTILKEELPVESFTEFSDESLPTNSDVIFVLSQYMEGLDRYRSKHVRNYVGRWYYIVDDPELDEEGKKKPILSSRPLSLDRKS